MSSELNDLAVFGEHSKIDIVNELARIYGWSRYLELCTPSTGLCFSLVDRERFSTCHRFIYRCPKDFDDGFNINFRAVNQDISEPLHEIRKLGMKYQVILVDPFHEYKETFRDLLVAFSLLEDGGALVVQNCYPLDKSLVSPRYHPGTWCGVTYKAYLDFTHIYSSKILSYTVDTDFGCGIIHRLPRSRGLLRNVFNSRKSRGEKLLGHKRRLLRQERRLFREWRRVGKDENASFAFFQKNAAPLLRLKSFDEFALAERSLARRD